MRRPIGSCDSSWVLEPISFYFRFVCAPFFRLSLDIHGRRIPNFVLEDAMHDLPSFSDALLKQLSSCVSNNFEKHQVPFLERLVNQPSHTYAVSDVEDAARIIDECAISLDMSIDVYPDAEKSFADHRIYRTPGTSAADRSIALVGHVDTVFPRSLGFLVFRRDTSDPGPAEAESGSMEALGQGDVIRGPGVLDMKSGLSSILFALRAIREITPRIYRLLKIRFICVTDEEVGSPSSKSLFADTAPFLSAALVFEAGREEDRIVTQRKGSGGFRITAQGRAAHAGNRHQDGINAIHALALMIPKIEALTNYDAGRTVNVGLIEGGTAKNTVPESAECTIDCRFEKIRDGKDLEAQMQELCEPSFTKTELPQRLQGTRFELSGGISRPPMESTAASQSLRERYETFAQDAGLRIGEAPLQGGGSDANLLAALDVPSIDGLGPYGKHFHKPQEWSSLDSLQKRTIALCWFLVAQVLEDQPEIL
jgi:glutamate carboxypeptidase